MSSDSVSRKFGVVAALFLSLLIIPQIIWAQSATDQLGGMTGTTIGRFTYHKMPHLQPIAPTKATGGSMAAGTIGASRGATAAMSHMPAAVGGMMMMSSFLGAAMQGMMDTASSVQLRAQQQAQYQEMQRWMAEEQQRLTKVVAEQRAQRDAESQAGLDEMAKAMSDPWDSGNRGPMNMAAALSDPNVVDLRPKGTPLFGTGGGDSKVVDLRDRTRDTAQIPDGKRAADVRAAAKTMPQSPAAAKLQKMIKENQDPAKLDGNLQKLEGKILKARELSEKIKQGTNFSPQDLEAWDKSMAQAAQEGMLRGLSLAMDFRGDHNAGPQAWYKEIKTNPARMKLVLNMMDNINEFADFADNYDKFKPGELKDLIWNDANRNLMKDLDFFRNQNAVNPSQFQSGKNMINESVGLAEKRDELGKIEVRVKIKGLSPFFWDRKKQLDQQAQRLAEATKTFRRDLALKKELPATPAKPEPTSPKPPVAPALFASPPVLKDLKVIPLDLKEPNEKTVPEVKSPPAAPPVPGRKYHRVVFQGVVGAKQEDQVLSRAIQNSANFQDPDQSYVFAFPGGPQSDKLMHHPETNPEIFFKKQPEIKHMEVDDLVFNGNMTPAIDMFIRRRLIKARHLVLITNDTSRNYPKLIELMTLAKEKGIMFSWYVNRNGKLEVFASPKGVNLKDLLPDS